MLLLFESKSRLRRLVKFTETAFWFVLEKKGEAIHLFWICIRMLFSNQTSVLMMNTTYSEQSSNTAHHTLEHSKSRHNSPTTHTTGSFLYM